MTDNGHHLPCYDRRPWSRTIPSVGRDDRESAEMKKSGIVVVEVLRKDDSSVPYDAPCHSLARRLDSFPTTELDHGCVIPKGGRPKPYCVCRMENHLRGVHVRSATAAMQTGMHRLALSPPLPLSARTYKPPKRIYPSRVLSNIVSSSLTGTHRNRML